MFTLDIFDTMCGESGVPPLDAIKTATDNGATFIRRENEIGSVEKGEKADLLIVCGNPADNIPNTRNIVHTIKGGKLVSRAALKYR